MNNSPRFVQGVTLGNPTKEGERAFSETIYGTYDVRARTSIHGAYARIATAAGAKKLCSDLKLRMVLSKEIEKYLPVGAFVKSNLYDPN